MGAITTIFAMLRGIIAAAACCWRGRFYSESPSGAAILFILLCCIAFPSVRAQESKYNYGEHFNFGAYMHVYPPVDISQDVHSCIPNETVTCPLFVAVILSFGSAFNSSGSLLGIQIALDQINEDPSILPGYKLHYLLKDSQVSALVKQHLFHVCSYDLAIKCNQANVHASTCLNHSIASCSKQACVKQALLCLREWRYLEKTFFLFL